VQIRESREAVEQKLAAVNKTLSERPHAGASATTEAVNLHADDNSHLGDMGDGEDDDDDGGDVDATVAVGSGGSAQV
jgi:hypothetical protein